MIHVVNSISNTYWLQSRLSMWVSTDLHIWIATIDFLLWGCSNTVFKF